jgi:hypothetical protein
MDTPTTQAELRAQVGAEEARLLAILEGGIAAQDRLLHAARRVKTHSIGEISAAWCNAVDDLQGWYDLHSERLGKYWTRRMLEVAK